MNVRSLLAAAGVVLACALGTGLSGCRAESEVTKEEAANFKGGPMPPGYNPQAGGASGAASRGAAPGRSPR